MICNKVARYSADFVHGPQRLLHPLRRTGPQGLGAIRTRLVGGGARRDLRGGPAPYRPLGAAGGDAAELCRSARLLLPATACPCASSTGSAPPSVTGGALCGGVRSEAWAGTYGAVPGCPPELAAHARLNIVWGNNATATNLHLVRSAQPAKRAGGRLVVVDPLRTKIAEQADLHLALLPGTDVLPRLVGGGRTRTARAPLDEAFIAANVLGFEEFMSRAREWPVARAASVCGLPGGQILTLVRWMAEADPLVLSPGNGLERGRNGGSGIRAAIALPALLGKLGKGSGIVLAAGNAFPKSLGPIAAAGSASRRHPNAQHPTDIGRHIAEDDIDPPLRALFIYNHNPIVVHPDQNRMRRGLARDDVFAVGIELDDDRKHDPIATLCCRRRPISNTPNSTLSYGHHWLQRAEPVILPVGELLPNTEIFRRLAARFGFHRAVLPCDPTPSLWTTPLMAPIRGSAVSGRAEIPTRKALQMRGSGRQADGPLRQHLPRRPRRARSSSNRRPWPRTLGCRCPAASKWRAAPPSPPLPRMRERMGGNSPDADLARFRQAHLLDPRRPRRLAQGAAALDEPRGCYPARGLGHGHAGYGVWNERGEVVLPPRRHRRGAARASSPARNARGS